MQDTLNRADTKQLPKSTELTAHDIKNEMFNLLSEKLQNNPKADVQSVLENIIHRLNRENVPQQKVISAAVLAIKDIISKQNITLHFPHRDIDTTQPTSRELHEIISDCINNPRLRFTIINNELKAIQENDPRNRFYNLLHDKMSKNPEGFNIREAIINLYNNLITQGEDADKLARTITEIINKIHSNATSVLIGDIPLTKKEPKYAISQDMVRLMLSGAGLTELRIIPATNNIVNFDRDLIPPTIESTSQVIEVPTIEQKRVRHVKEIDPAELGLISSTPHGIVGLFQNYITGTSTADEKRFLERLGNPGEFFNRYKIDQTTAQITIPSIPQQTQPQSRVNTPVAPKTPNPQPQVPQSPPQQPQTRVTPPTPQPKPPQVVPPTPPTIPNPPQSPQKQQPIPPQQPPVRPPQTTPIPPQRPSFENLPDQAGVSITNLINPNVNVPAVSEVTLFSKFNFQRPDSGYYAIEPTLLSANIDENNFGNLLNRDAKNSDVFYMQGKEFASKRVKAVVDNTGVNDVVLIRNEITNAIPNAIDKRGATLNIQLVCPAGLGEPVARELTARLAAEVKTNLDSDRKAYLRIFNDVMAKAKAGLYTPTRSAPTAPTLPPKPPTAPPQVPRNQPTILNVPNVNNFNTLKDPRRVFELYESKFANLKESRQQFEDLKRFVKSIVGHEWKIDYNTAYQNASAYKHLDQVSNSDSAIDIFKNAFSQNLYYRSHGEINRAQDSIFSAWYTVYKLPEGRVKELVKDNFKKYNHDGYNNDVMGGFWDDLINNLQRENLLQTFNQQLTDIFTAGINTSNLADTSNQINEQDVKSMINGITLNTDTKQRNLDALDSIFHIIQTDRVNQNNVSNVFKGYEINFLITGKVRSPENVRLIVLSSLISSQNSNVDNYLRNLKSLKTENLVATTLLQNIIKGCKNEKLKTKAKQILASM